jgi:hypothetical protein
MPPDAVLAQSYQCFSQPWGAHVEPLACLLLLTQYRDVRRERLALRGRVQGATAFMSFGCDAMQLQENKEEKFMATEARETAGLIGSDKVEGTYVYDAKGENIGSIERVMIDKRSGQVAYAVLQFGGFLGIGSDYYPIPWDSRVRLHSVGYKIA